MDQRRIPQSLEASKYHALKADWAIVKTMAEQSGWGWDETTHMVTCTDGVWDAYGDGLPGGL